MATVTWEIIIDNDGESVDMRLNGTPGAFIRVRVRWRMPQANEHILLTKLKLRFPLDFRIVKQRINSVDRGRLNGSGNWDISILVQDHAAPAAFAF